MPKIVLEDRFEGGGFSIERYKEAKERNEWCLELYGVTHLMSYISSDAKRMICIFEAPDAEAVRQLSRKLGYSYESVWEATAVR